MDMSYCILIINTMGRKLGSFYISVHKIEIWCLTFWTLGETTTRFLIKDIFESSMVLHLIIVVDSFNFICFSGNFIFLVKRIELVLINSIPVILLMTSISIKSVKADALNFLYSERILQVVNYMHTWNSWEFFSMNNRHVPGSLSFANKQVE